MNKQAYELYVKTDCWELTRSNYMRDHGRCEVCSLAPTEQIYHLDYSRLGHETPDDLLAVCDACHRLLHRLPGPQSQLLFAISGLSSMIVALEFVADHGGRKAPEKYYRTLALLRERAEKVMV